MDSDSKGKNELLNCGANTFANHNKKLESAHFLLGITFRKGTFQFQSDMYNEWLINLNHENNKWQSSSL